MIFFTAKLKNLFGLTVLLFLQSSCMDHVVSTKDEPITVDLEVFKYLPHDLFFEIVPYSDCKTMAAWKCTCRDYNKAMHYYQIPAAIIEREDYTMITRGLMYIADTYPHLHQTMPPTDTDDLRNNITLTSNPLADLCNKRLMRIEETDANKKNNPYSRRKLTRIGNTSTSLQQEETDANKKNNPYSSRRLARLGNTSTSLHQEKPDVNKKNNSCTRRLMRIEKTDASLQQEKSDINKKNFENLLHNNFIQRIADVELLLDWVKNIYQAAQNKAAQDETKDAFSAIVSYLFDDIFYVYKGEKYHNRKSFHYKTLPLDVFNRIVQINPNALDAYGHTPLSWACDNDNTTIIQQLLTNKRCNPNIIDDYYKRTVLYDACLRNKTNIIKLLLTCPKTDPTIIETRRSDRLETAISIAFQRNYPEIVTLFAIHQDTEGNTTLQKACKTGHLESVRLLLTHQKTNPNSQNNQGDTALHIACQSGFLDIVSLLLLDKKTDPNIKNNNNDTALNIAREYKHTNIIQLLLAHPNTQDTDGNTILHQACLDDDITLIQLLLKDIRTNVNITNNLGQTVFDIAHSKNNNPITKLLLTHPNIKDNHGNTVLHKACLKNDIKTIGKLLNDIRTDLEIQNTAGLTALDIALSKHHTEIIDLLLSNKKDINGNTRLHRACLNNDIEEIKRLLAIKTTNLNIQNNTYNTPACIACEQNNIEIVTLLLNHPRTNLFITNQQGLAILTIKTNYTIEQLVKEKLAHRVLTYCIPGALIITTLTVLLSYYVYTLLHNNSISTITPLPA